MACGAPIEVEFYPPMQGRACRFCLCLQGGSVFADFDVDQDGRVYCVRVSFDGHGCCRPPAVVAMSREQSRALLAMVEARELTDTVGVMLRSYFRANLETIWADALEEHDLV